MNEFYTSLLYSRYENMKIVYIVEVISIKIRLLPSLKILESSGSRNILYYLLIHA